MKPLHETLGKMKQGEFLKRCMTDFGFFCDRVLNLNVMPYHIEWANMFYNSKRSCIIAFRGSGKSTICSVAFPLWLMAFDEISRKDPHRQGKPLKFMVVSPTIKQSKKNLKDAKNFITNVEFLNQILYPDMAWRAGLMWTKTEIETKNGCQMFVQPYTENMRSEHVNYILADEASLFRDLNIFDRACIPMASMWPGNICVIGTPMTEYDLLARCQLADSGYRISRYQAMKDGSPAWDWRYSMNDLEQKRKEMGEISFAREYLCEVVSEESRCISSKSIAQACRPDTALLVNLTGDGTPRTINGTSMVPTRYTGVDLAMSAHGDYSVSITLREHEGGFIIEHMDRRKGMGSQAHKEWLTHIWRGLRPIRMPVDKSQFGQYLIDDLNMAGIPVEPFKFTPDSRKEILGGLFQMIDSGRIMIPRDPNDPITMTMTDALIHELASFVPTRTATGIETYKATSSHDDTVMALAVAASITPHGSATSESGFHFVSW